MRVHPLAAFVVLPLAACAPLALDPALTPAPTANPLPTADPTAALSSRTRPDAPDALPPAAVLVRRRPARDDLDADGHPDPAVGAPAHRRVVVYASAAASPIALDSPFALFGASLAYVGDLDGDGLSDLAVGAPGDDAVVLFAGDRRGVDPTPRAVLRGPSGSGFGATLAASGDLDGDGRVDLLVGSPAGHAVSLVRGGAAMPTAVSATSEGPADEGFATALAPFGDGRVAVALPGEGSIAIVTARDARIALRAQIRVAETRLTEMALAVLDVDGDARLDLAVTAGGLPGVAWIRATADGFAAPAMGPAGSGAGAVLANATDLDGDGDDELLLASGAGLWVIPGDAAGLLAPVPWSPARSGSTASLWVARDPGADGRALVLRGVPGEDAVELLAVDGALDAPATVATITGAAGSAFGAALAR